MPSAFDPYYTWLAIPPEEQPPHLYRLLGLRPFEENLDVIENAADQRMAYLRSIHAGTHEKLAQQILNELSGARICLLNADKKAAYDQELRKKQVRPAPPAPPAPAAAPAPESRRDSAVFSFVRDMVARQPAPSERYPLAKTAAKRRKKQNTALMVGVVGAVVGIALAGLLGLWLLAGSGRERTAALVLDFPTEEREGLSLSINGTAVGMPASGPLVHRCEPGKHRIRATRKGFRPLDETVTVGTGEQKKFTPAWVRVSYLLVPWTDEDRRGTTLVVDNRPQTSTEPTSSGQVRIALEPGKHRLRMSRLGFEPFEEEFTIAAGQNASVRPAWKPLEPIKPIGPLAEEKPKPDEPEKTKEPPEETAKPKPKTEPGDGGDESKRLAAPSGETQQKILDQMEQVYELSKPRTPEAKLKLAKKLLEESKKPGPTGDERFVYLRETMELAGDAGDVWLMLDSADAANAQFEIDGLALKQKLLARLAAGASDSTYIKAVVDGTGRVIEQALAVDAYGVAMELANRAYAACQKPHGKPFQKLVAERRAEIRKLCDQWEEIEKVRNETLKANPEDPEANFTVGQWYCLRKGNWEKGLPYLAAGNNEALKKLAGQELKSPPTEPTEQVQLADAWWDAAQQSKAAEVKDALLLHAGSWYRQALPKLEEGLQKKEVAKRLEEIGKVKTTAPEPPRRKPSRKTLPNSIGMTMVLLTPGEFDMGTTPEQIARITKEIKERETRDLSGLDKAKELEAKKIQEITGRSYTLTQNTAAEGPRHRVQITRPLYMSAWPVTQAEYQSVMGVNPSRVHAENRQHAAKAKSQVKDTSRWPVEGVSWEDAQSYCRRLSAMPRERQGRRTYRLPTEAEWEFACRAGQTTEYFFGDNPAQLGNYAWFRSNAGDAPHPVGQKQANAFGLFDMHGNVGQWCQDWFGADYYKDSLPNDPRGPNSGTLRVVRGGSFKDEALQLRDASRRGVYPTAREITVGFRVVFEPL